MQSLLTALIEADFALEKGHFLNEVIKKLGASPSFLYRVRVIWLVSCKRSSGR